MPALHVAFMPAEAAPAAVVIVVDAIRATTTIATALAAGYERVVCAGEIETARAEARRIGAGALLGGEREGVRIDGFDLGNSPAEYEEPRGHTVVLSTTNGTRAILQAAAEAEHVLVGALVCLAAVAREAARLAGGRDVAVRCAGVRGAVAFDDVYTAGSLVAALLELVPDVQASDAARAALAVSQTAGSPLEAFAASQSARDLDGTGLEGDVARCARVSILEVAPRVRSVAAGLSVVRC